MDAKYIPPSSSVLKRMSTTPGLIIQRDIAIQIEQNEFVVISPWEDSEETWRGKVMEIRLSESQKAWVQIQWLYSARDTRNISWIGGRLSDSHQKAVSSLGTHEYLISDHFDWVSSEALLGPCEILHYNDMPGCSPFEVSPKALFYRFSLVTTRKHPKLRV
ncbi:hypothetical protein PTI98_007179 [Pleurotus ostreatus]|nr:hypothetical protein PTI98_007179 [Pleurotus ostreatus]